MCAIKKKILIISAVILSFITLILSSTLAVNVYMSVSADKQIYSTHDKIESGAFDCIIVLGAGVNGDTPSDMLKDRLLAAIELYQNGIAPKLLMSGDHGQIDYDEVNVMKSFAIEHGVPSEDIFMDHAGFSTYESIYRASEIFGVKTAVIVSQEYHLPRALHIADELGIEAVGISADTRQYRGELYRNCREYLARCKDFFQCIFKPEPTYLGEKIPISGNGDITNDK